MSRKRNKKYNPHGKYNPVVIRHRIDEINGRIRRHNENVNSVRQANDNHINLLGNFAKHDIKNAIQTMDSILTSNTVEELDQDKINALKSSIDTIRSTMDNFAQLIPYSTGGSFKFTALMVAVELMSRALVTEKKIHVEVNFVRT